MLPLNETLSSILPFSVILLFVIILSQKQAAQAATLLKKQAIKRNGQVKTLWLSAIPTLQFPFENCVISVNLSHIEDKHQRAPNILRCRLPYAVPYQMSVMHESSVARVTKLFRDKNIQIPDISFNQAFLVWGNDEMTVTNFLTAEIKQALLNISEFYPTMAIRNGNFTLLTIRKINNESELDRFIETGLILLKKILAN